MKQLETHRSRWSCLEPAETMAVNLPGTLGAYKFVDGMFSAVTGEQRTSLHFIPLPPASGGITQKKWSIDNFPMPIDCYTTDPSSDLLIVYEDQSSEHSRYVVSLQPGRTRGWLILCRQDSSSHPSRLRRGGTSKSCFANYRTPGGR